MSGVSSGCVVDSSPLLKWVGGKKRMLPHLLPHYSGQPQVVEPFFGGGALSFHLSAADSSLRVVANDFLADVMDIYRAVAKDVESFIAGVDVYADPYVAFESKSDRRAFYYQVRDRYRTRALDGPEPLFFLLWCAYSGLFRSTSKYPGRFNTPHGFGSEKPGFYHPERLRAAAPRMGGWTFTDGDFADTLAHVNASSFVFLDPPYRGTFTGYTGDGFSETDQIRVAEFFRAAAAKGAKVVYTNKDTGDGFYAKHFAGFSLQRVPIKYSVNANSSEVGHHTTHEVVISN